MINKTTKTQLRRLANLWLVLLAACVMIAEAGAQGVRGGGPPTVAITQVLDLGDTGAQRRFRVDWTAQKPPLTTISKFGVTLEVRFTGGVTKTGVANAGASATSATITFSGLQANAKALDFKATVSPTFTTPEFGSTTVTRDFNLDTDAIQGGVGSGVQLPPDRPIVQIASATTIDVTRFEVKWNVQAAQGIYIERFGLSGEVTYQPKQSRDNPVPPVTKQSPVSIALGSQRKGSVVIQNPPTGASAKPLRIKVTLVTGFNAPVERTIQTIKAGRF